MNPVTPEWWTQTIDGPPIPEGITVAIIQRAQYLGVWRDRMGLGSTTYHKVSRQDDKQAVEALTAVKAATDWIATRLWFLSLQWMAL